MVVHSELQRRDSRTEVPGRSTAIAALVAAFVTLWLAPIASGTIQPGEFLVHFLYPAIPAAVCIVAALRASRATKVSNVRIMAGVALFISLGSLICPADGYFDTFHVIPWIPLGVLAGTVIVGCWLCGQRTIAIGFACGLGAFVSPLFRAPHPGPSTLVSGDLSVSLDCSVAPDCRITLKSLSGTDLSKEFELARLQFGGAVASWRVPCPSRRRRPVPEDLDGSLPKSEYRLTAEAYVPVQARSWDACISVRRRNAPPGPKAESEVRFDFPGLPRPR